MESVTLTMALLMGLTGSLHCAGMCGPIIWVMPFQQLSGYKRWLGIIFYHIGRVSVYTLLAILLYSFRSVFQPQWQQYISIVMGAFLLIAGILSFIPKQRFKVKLPWTSYIQSALSRLMAKPGLGVLFTMGMLNGLLPCGLVYMALSATMVTASVSEAAYTMVAFGVGTAPMLIALTILKNRAKLSGMVRLRKFVPLFMLFFGMLFVVRGMNLGIPYLSPKIAVEQNEIKAECCHK